MDCVGFQIRVMECRQQSGGNPGQGLPHIRNVLHQQGEKKCPLVKTMASKMVLFPLKTARMLF